MVRQWLEFILSALVGWVICGFTILQGRKVIPMDSVLILHAIVAPVAFGLLSWRFCRRYRGASAARVSVGMLGFVVALDAGMVAPFLEHSYAMFQSLLGTWVPFGLILIGSYAGARAAGRQSKGIGAS